MAASTEETIDGPLAAVASSLATSGAAAERSDPGLALAAGARIGRYVVLSRIGAGAMGVVLAAHDPELDRKVAIKLLRSGHHRDHEAACARLQREAQALARLNHPNVVGVLDVGIHDGQVFVAMELVLGHTLGEWTHGRPRPWREVLRVMTPAGRGLAAAHEQGLVHRDFKPENVMLGTDGRTRVLDFGLARAETETREHEAPREPSSESLERDAMATPLTRTGHLAGTPAYMAPEQIAGLDVTAKADQFAFCVSLYELLYCVRPFRQESTAALALAITEGRIGEVPAGSAVPRWLRQVVLGGLASKPEDRHADMSTLLAALAAGEARVRRRRILGAAAAIAIAGVVVFAGANGYARWDEARRAAACHDDGRDVVATWNDEARDRMLAGLRATGVPFAVPDPDKLTGFFDAQADALRTAQTEACLDARVRGVWSEELLDRATWCVEQRQLQLEAAVEQLTAADEHSVQRAVQVAAALSEVSPCRDPSRLRHAPLPPKGRDAALAVQATIARAAALRHAGKYGDATTTARGALQEARALGWQPAVIAAGIELGVALSYAEQHVEAQEHLEAAYFAAADIGAEELACDAAVWLAYTVGEGLAQPEAALEWIRHADTALTTLGVPADGLRRADVADRTGLVRITMGDYDEARAQLERALAIREAALGPDHLLVASSLNLLAHEHIEERNLAIAAPLLERALAIRERALGTEHPQVAETLNNLALVRQGVGDVEGAEQALRRAMRILEHGFGADYPGLAPVIANLGNLQLTRGAYDDARVLCERALLLSEKLHGPDHPSVAASLNDLAAVHATMGHHAEAERLFARALATQERALGPEHPDLASTLNNLGLIHTRMGKLVDARAELERALAIRTKTFGSDHPLLANSLQGLAEVAIADRRAADAIAPAERAVAVSASSGAPPQELAESRFILANALWEAPKGKGRDRPRARELAVQSRDAQREIRGDPAALERVERWLAQH